MAPFTPCWQCCTWPPSPVFVQCNKSLHPSISYRLFIANSLTPLSPVRYLWIICLRAPPLPSCSSDCQGFLIILGWSNLCWIDCVAHIQPTFLASGIHLLFRYPLLAIQSNPTIRPYWSCTEDFRPLPPMVGFISAA